WRDRSLEVPGVDDYVGRGLLYQNPLIYWFNHKNERAYSGPRYDIPDGTLCVGGGLASIDVIKVIQLEIYERALRRRGVEITMQELEHEGIAKFLEKRAIDPKSLGVVDGMLIYRRRVEDMPLADTPAGATIEQLNKAEGVRRKILEVCRRKFLFRFDERRLPQKMIVDDERLVGLRVTQTRVEGKKAEPIPGSEHELRVPLVISSIGSVPERIPGIRMKGDSYVYKSWDTGEYEDIPGVFGIGNVVTGKGNIRDSLEHGESVAQHIIEAYLGIGGTRDVMAVTGPAVQAGLAHSEAVIDHVAVKAPLAADKASAVLHRVHKRQRQVGFERDYRAWIESVTPPDLE
ncbi:MAG: hypothetical protein M3O46_11515, partial [Myxococcota bacterium]|nr:hypothetical protein [Myxococcota bacterium]